MESDVGGSLSLSLRLWVDPYVLGIWAYEVTPIAFTTLVEAMTSSGDSLWWRMWQK